MLPAVRGNELAALLRAELACFRQGFLLCPNAAAENRSKVFSDSVRVRSGRDDAAADSTPADQHGGKDSDGAQADGQRRIGLWNARRPAPSKKPQFCHHPTLRRQDPAVPSDRFRKLAKLNLARQLAN
jgi:hypothetical protein